MQHLVELGHEKIGFIGGPPNVQSSQDRMAVYREILAEQGLPARKSGAVYADFTQAAGRNEGQQMLGLPPRPTAIFAANDMIALGVLEAAEDLGLRVPEDLSVVGYDNIRYASLPRIQLTTVAQPTHEMGRIAAEYLLGAIERGRQRKLARVLRPRLVVRRTTARARWAKRSLEAVSQVSTQWLCWRHGETRTYGRAWERIWQARLGTLDEVGKIEWARAFLDGSFVPAKRGAKRSD